MEMSKPQRDDLAARVAEVRLTRYGGNRKAAYTDAGVNSATWTRVESGLSIAERSCVAIIATLWPESGGDWRRLDPPLGSGRSVAQILEELDRANVSESTKAYIREALSGHVGQEDGGVKGA